MTWPQPMDVPDSKMQPEVYVQRSAPDPRLQLTNMPKRRPTPPKTLPIKKHILPVLHTTSKDATVHGNQ